MKTARIQRDYVITTTIHKKWLLVRGPSWLRQNARHGSARMGGDTGVLYVHTITAEIPVPSRQHSEEAASRRCLESWWWRRDSAGTPSLARNHCTQLHAAEIHTHTQHQQPTNLLPQSSSLTKSSHFSLHLFAFHKHKMYIVRAGK